MNERSDLYYGNPRGEMLPFVPDCVRRILEVGCANGAFGAALRNGRPSIESLVGIESDTAVLGAIPDGIYDHLLLGRFPDDYGGIRMPESFDCIIFNDVLEHMEDPWSAVRFASELLEPMGCLVASIPNVRYLPVLKDLVIHGNWEYADAGVLDRTHLRFFTRRTIASMFRDASFEPVIHGINPMARRVARLERWLPWVGDLVCRQYAVRATNAQGTSQGST